MPGELIAGHEDLKAECTNCHVRLRDTTQKELCLGCHDHKPVADDIANEQGFHGKDRKARTLDCKACHSDHKGRDAKVIWLDQDTFIHRFTDYDLIGKHKLVDCKSCHLENKKYREAEQDCYACHSEDDAHDGQLGKKCGDCHDPVGWGQSEFDHDKTDFKLRFGHQKVNCNACHIKGKYEDTPKACVSCHAIKDIHLNRFGDKCESCHSEKSWDQSKFDHDRDTEYPLEGKHRGPGCNDCHSPDYRAPAKKEQIRSCYSCHREDDVHNELNGEECDSCHVVRGWAYAEFDHAANTDFALNGAHFDLTCEACHALGAETKEIDMDCHSCHKKDDVHQRDQGTGCDQCHREVSWLQDVRFDHDLTQFPLIGQHAATGCEACHETSVFTEASSECAACHGADDVHKQALGDDCRQCHNSNDWLIWAFDHDKTDFKLRNAHAELHCHTCHYRPVEEEIDISTRCVNCHRRDDIHDGQFGSNCDRCHNDEAFDRINARTLKTLGRKVSADARE
jgi:hypothetical protein